MKKVFFCGVVLCLILTGMAFANRPEIEEVIGSYEAIVVEAENLAGMPLVDTNDFSAVDEKANAAEAKIAAVQNEREWLIQDAKQVAMLRARFNQAMAMVIQKLMKY